MRIVYLSLLSWIALVTAFAANAEDRPPNVVFILADDLGYADTSATGSRSIRTPHIDSLAAAGVTMTNAYSASPICSPTRTALFTGLYPQRFDIGLEEPLISRRAESGLGLPLDQPTIASLFQELGYKTSLVGKWHLGQPPEHSPIAHGYDSFFGFVQGAADYFRHTMVRQGESVGQGLFVDRKEVERPGYLTDLLGDEAVRQINSTTEQPFFMSLHFNAPHWPWEGRNDEQIAQTLERTQHYDGGSLETYQEMVEVMDANVGRVLTALGDKGLSNNTIVIFTSDNGGERFSDTWPYVGVKGEVLEGGIRVPLFVRWPDKVEAGSRSTQVLSTMDFLPTLVSAAGGDVSKLQLDGANLLAQILGDSNSSERTLFWRYKANQQGAVRRGDWKFVHIAGEGFLFNLKTDPRERARLEKKFPEIYAALSHSYAQWNASMLPYPPDSFSDPVSNTYVDRYD